MEVDGDDNFEKMSKWGIPSAGEIRAWMVGSLGPRAARREDSEQRSKNKGYQQCVQTTPKQTQAMYSGRNLINNQVGPKLS